MEVIDNTEHFVSEPEVAGRKVLLAGVNVVFDRVLVKIVEKVNDSVIKTANAFEEPSDIGEVISVGQAIYQGGKTVPIPFTKGDFVKFGSLTMESVKFDDAETGEKYAMIRAQDVRCYWNK